MMKSYLLAIVLSMILLTVLNRFLSEKNKCENKIKWQHYLFGYIFMFYLVVSINIPVGYSSTLITSILLSLNTIFLFI